MSSIFEDLDKGKRFEEELQRARAPTKKPMTFISDIKTGYSDVKEKMKKVDKKELKKKLKKKPFSSFGFSGFSTGKLFR